MHFKRLAAPQRRASLPDISHRLPLEPEDELPKEKFELSPVVNLDQMIVQSVLERMKPSNGWVTEGSQLQVDHSFEIVENDYQCEIATNCNACNANGS